MDEIEDIINHSGQHDTDYISRAMRWLKRTIAASLAKDTADMVTRFIQRHLDYSQVPIYTASDFISDQLELQSSLNADMAIHAI